MKLKLISRFKLAGDQPRAIEKLTKNLQTGVKHQVLLGVTGSGKTFTMASVIHSIQRPTLIISHNKTLAAQLYQEFKDFFPTNAVHYFVSYYDYYQPEAYIPQTDTYIEKDSKINEEIDGLRHAATQSLLTRKDAIVIASVSCIYNIGSPEIYQNVSLNIKIGQTITRKEFLNHLASLQYQRNETDFKPGTFRFRGEIIEIFSATGQEIIKVEFSRDKIKKMVRSGDSEKKSEISNLKLFPAHFWVGPQEKIKLAVENIKLELEERLTELRNQKKLIEVQRLEQRTNHDLEMLRETGFCHGIENYSRHLEFRKKGEPSYTLLDYFPEDFLTIIDESHMTVPQVRGMYNGDRARKETLIEYGFRLPSALDNRPLKFGEFEEKIGQTIYVSATPGEYEMEKIKNIKSETKAFLIEQLIRPTGLLEPSIEIRPEKNQVKDLVFEIKKRVAKKQRVLVITLTKRLAEALSDFLSEKRIKVHYLHSEVKTLERPAILRDLRLGGYDVLVGINLLREGLDLPEVSLVAILDADKEGFLRNETTLIQTMGRASRHLEGHIILYADKITGSMKKAIKEINRRRKIQMAYNKKHKIVPRPIIKVVRDWSFGKESGELSGKVQKIKNLNDFEKFQNLKELEKEMKLAVKNLNFERAAQIRDYIKKINEG